MENHYVALPLVQCAGYWQKICGLSRWGNNHTRMAQVKTEVGSFVNDEGPWEGIHQNQGASYQILLSCCVKDPQYV